MDWQQVFSTLFGTVAGFVFSIALFYLTERAKRENARRKILRGLRRELEYDLALFNSWLSGIEDARLKVASGDKAVFLYIDYTRVLSIFIGEALRTGILYDKLTDEQLVGLDKALRSCNGVAEQDFSDKLNQWMSDAIDSAEMSRTLNFHTFMISGSRDALKSVLASVGSAD